MKVQVTVDLEVPEATKQAISEAVNQKLLHMKHDPIMLEEAAKQIFQHHMEDMVAGFDPWEYHDHLIACGQPNGLYDLFAPHVKKWVDENGDTIKKQVTASMNDVMSEAITDILN